MSQIVQDIKWAPPTVTNCDVVESTHWASGCDWHIVYLAAARMLQQPVMIGFAPVDDTPSGGPNWWSDWLGGQAYISVRMPAFSRHLEEAFQAAAPLKAGERKVRLTLWDASGGPPGFPVVPGWTSVENGVPCEGISLDTALWVTTTAMAAIDDVAIQIPGEAFPLIASIAGSPPSVPPLPFANTQAWVRLVADPQVWVFGLWLQAGTAPLARLDQW